MRAVVHRIGEAATIVALLISVILGTALASTVVKQSDNARGEAGLQSKTLGNSVGGSTENATPYTNASPIFGLYPLMWAVVILAVAAGVVIKLL